jgi:iron complex transport system ATP-binding protein
VTAGALNRLDTDWEVARSLGIPVAEEAPFSHLGGEALSETRAHADAAEVVVLACLPFGQGNLANLQVAEDALRQGKPVIMCDYAPIAERDFTGGEAAGIYQRILAGGGRPVASPAELRSALGERITRKEEQEKL